MIFKKILIPLLIILMFSFVYAEQPTENKKIENNFSAITYFLEGTYEKIRSHSVNFDLTPYTKEKGEKLLNDVYKIILEDVKDKKYIPKRPPSVALMVSPVGPDEAFLYLQISMILYETDTIIDNDNVMGDLIIIKHIFIRKVELLKPNSGV